MTRSPAALAEELAALNGRTVAINIAVPALDVRRGDPVTVTSVVCNGSDVRVGIAANERSTEVRDTATLAALLPWGRPKPGLRLRVRPVADANQPDRPEPPPGFIWGMTRGMRTGARYDIETAGHSVTVSHGTLLESYSWDGCEAYPPRSTSPLEDGLFITADSVSCASALQPQRLIPAVEEALGGRLCCCGGIRLVPPDVVGGDCLLPVVLMLVAAHLGDRPPPFWCAIAPCADAWTGYAVTDLSIAVPAFQAALTEACAALSSGGRYNTFVDTDAGAVLFGRWLQRHGFGTEALEDLDVRIALSV